MPSPTLERSDALRRLDKRAAEVWRRELGQHLTDPDRLADVYHAGYLSASDKAKLQSLVMTAAGVTGCCGSEINLITDTEQRTLASHSNESTEPIVVPVEDSYCQHQVALNAPLRIEDSLSHVLVCDSVATTERGVRSYLGVPIYSLAGRVVGSFCVYDDQPRTWTATHVEVLTNLAAVAMATLQED